MAATVWQHRQKWQRHLLFKLNLIFIVILHTIVQDSVNGLFVRWEQKPICLNGHDHLPVAHDCHAFYHCWGPRLTIKNCGPFLMFNPVTKVCDWPGVVKYIRPMCDPNHKPPKKRKTELTRVDLIKPTLNELATKTSTTKTVGKLLHARTTTKSTTMTTTTTTTTTSTTTTKIVPRTEFVGKLLHARTTTTTTTKRPKIFFIKPITLRKRPPKDINLKNRNTKSLIGYNGLFDLNSLKVFTKDNVTSLSS